MQKYRVILQFPIINRVRTVTTTLYCIYFEQIKLINGLPSLSILPNEVVLCASESSTQK